MPKRLPKPRHHGFLVAPFPEAVPAARKRVATVVRRWQLGLPDSRIQDMQVLADEVISNAMLHTEASCAVCVRWTGARARVEVTDAMPDLPQIGSAGLEAESGRGLLLVSRLSAAWGARPDRAGKVVWFDIVPERIRPASTSGSRQLSRSDKACDRCERDS